MTLIDESLIAALALRSDSAMSAVATSAGDQALDCWQARRLGNRHRPLTAGCDPTVFLQAPLHKSTACCAVIGRGCAYAMEHNRAQTELGETASIGADRCGGAPNYR